MRKQGAARSLNRSLSEVTQKKLQRGLALQQAGQRAKASGLYEEILKIDPDHFDALQLSALVSYEMGEFDKAEVLYLRALRIRPDSAGVCANYGTMLHRLGRYEAAVEHYDNAVMIDPQLAVAYMNRGVALSLLGRYDEAIASHDKAISLKPRYIDAHVNRGNTFKELKRFPEALACYDKAISIDPNYVEAHLQRANVLKDLERDEEALKEFDLVLAVRPTLVEAHSGRGLALQKLNRLDEAFECFTKALALSPDNAQTLSYRGIVLHGLKKYDAALADLKKSVSIRPDYAAAYSNLGVVLKDMRRFHESIEAFFNAASVDKNKPSVYWNLATLLLLIGNFRDGWEFYEWRKKIDKPFGSRTFNRPVWLGQESLEGRTILIHAEQGIGDVIQFSRYVKFLESMAAKVIFAVPDKLMPIIRSLSEHIVICSDKEITTPFDFHCPLISLPYVFKTDIDTIPFQSSYLSADQQYSKSLRERILDGGDKKICGVSWLSKSEKNGADRSIKLVDLFSAIDPTGYVFVNLQYGDMFAEVADLKQKTGVDIITIPEIDNYDDMNGFAALVDACDVVLSIDNTTVHVAGALGKPTLVMLPYVPDWRWMIDRGDSPWYPSLQLFRQHDLDDWSVVLPEVNSALGEWR